MASKSRSRSGGESRQSKTTTDHEQIRQWVEQRGGRPARVKRTGDGGDPGLLRIDYPGYGGEESLEEISWDDFFQKFDEENLAFVYQEETSGGEPSRFSKLVHRSGQGRHGRSAR